MANKLTGNELNDRISWTLNQKIDHSLGAIEQFYNYTNGKSYISFSGGKDSTVLLHLVRMIYPNMEAVFINTGKEFPEIQQFVKTIDNVRWMRPKYTFAEIVKKYGFPYPSKEVSQKIYEIRHTNSDKLRNKRLFGDEKGNGKVSEKWKHLIYAPFEVSNQCCNKLKKEPAHRYEKETGNRPITGQMASESSLRKMQYLKSGCNVLEGKKIISNPLSIWTDKDIWDYITKFNIPYSKIYDMGYERTGCFDCLFGINMDKEQNRFQRLHITHPAQWNYSVNVLGIGKILDYEQIKYK